MSDVYRTSLPAASVDAMIAEDPESRCHCCGGPNVSWCAPSPLWNYVMRGDDISGAEPFDGIVCPTCFAVVAEQMGVGDLWRLEPQRVTVPLKTTTPSGRVWNPERWMWEHTAATDNK